MQATGREYGARGAVFGNEFYAGSLGSAADLIVDRAASRLGGYATFTGAHGVTSAPHNAEWRAALDGAWCNFPDGAPVAWRMRHTGLPRAQRIPGPDMFPLVILGGRSSGLRHFLFGSTEPVLDGLEVRLRALAPGVEIAGTLSPPFRPLATAEDAGIIDAIAATDPHILWVGLGAPKQDLWMLHNAHRLPGVLCIGVGAAFDFISGNKSRAPEWMQRTGMEWFHRLARNPRTLGPRYAMATSRFVALVATDFARQELNRRRRMA
jgi:N-acetylglucosaminyldiphosphoundecaprenol N-acetyl-beta-D-mannosaminyltransferase